MTLGVIKTISFVDKDFSITDSLTEKGITIKATNTSFEWFNTNIN